MHFNEYWNDLIMNQLPILFPMVFINIIQDDLSVVKGDLYSVKIKEIFFYLIIWVQKMK
jgi:hypothetical protein